MLRFIPPLEPTLTDHPPDGDNWIHEIKQDGYRTILIIESGAVRAYTRQGNDWTSTYRPIVDAARGLRCSTAIIDGEMIIQDEMGRSDFLALQANVHRHPERLAFIAFDLLQFDDEDIRRRPIEDRRGQLMDLVGAGQGPIAFSDAIVGDGRRLFDLAMELELEGVVSKKLGSIYVSGKSKSWLKSKTFVIDAYDVIGVTRTPGEAPLALLASKGQYVGNAVVSLSADLREAFWRYIDAKAIDRPTVRADGKFTTWVSPGMTAQVKHLVGEGKLRHASLREVHVPGPSDR